MKRYFPINLDLVDKKAVIIGAGKVAEAKIKKLLLFGADILVISPSATNYIEGLAKKKRLRLIRKRYVGGAIKGASLVFAATDEEVINKQVLKDAKKYKILINRVDVSKKSDFISPAIIRRRNFSVAVSTDGRNPALAKKIRQRLEKIL